MESEDLEEVENKEELNEKTLGQDTYATDDTQRVKARELNASLEEGGGEELEEDFDLSEILAELSEEKEKELDEAKKEDKEEMDEAKKDEEKEKMDEAEEAEAEEEAIAKANAEKEAAAKAEQERIAKENEKKAKEEKIAQEKLAKQQEKEKKEEVEYVRGIFTDMNYGILEALMFIDQNRNDYSTTVVRELDMFLRESARMFAPVEEVEYDLVSSDGTVIDSYTVRI